VLFGEGQTLIQCPARVLAPYGMWSSGSPDSQGFGGGIYIVSGATVYLDSFTVTNTINNTDGSGLNGPTANIDGTYLLRNC
jgi:hypothetical protein